MNKPKEELLFYIYVVVALFAIIIFSVIMYAVNLNEKNSKKPEISQTNSLNTTNKPASLEALFEEIVKKNDTPTDTSK